MTVGFRIRHSAAILLCSFLAINPKSISAQSLPPGVRPGPDGTIYVSADVTQEEFDQINEALGGAADDGSITTGEICDAVMDQLPGGLLRGLADIGSLFGICPSQSDVIGDALEDSIFPTLKEKCEALSGVYPTTLSARGCEWPAFMVLECKFTPPGIPHTCDGLRELCEMSDAGAGISPPDRSGPGQLGGSFKIPGCECTAFYVDGGPPEVCGVPGPITHAQTFHGY